MANLRQKVTGLALTGPTGVKCGHVATKGDGGSFTIGPGLVIPDARFTVSSTITGSRESLLPELHRNPTGVTRFVRVPGSGTAEELVSQVQSEPGSARSPVRANHGPGLHGEQVTREKKGMSSGARRWQRGEAGVHEYPGEEAPAVPSTGKGGVPLNGVFLPPLSLRSRSLPSL
ncbi:Hypothetical predicted protein [Lynx pardinus]|uniref:Uncharacterized protein n=1 Tax=Lynx pardinus TaxID=191816 RepID=A0A485MWZ2_LYNPA|nr:Hypothetical predicted protein [Lynx pardinus]